MSIGCLEQPAWRALADRVDGPLAMTSANQSGTVPDDELVTVEMALEHVGDEVDFVLKPDSTHSHPPHSTPTHATRDTTRASTILRLAGEPEILRRGDVTTSGLTSVVPDLFDSHDLPIEKTP